jgi:hypothetical protein
VTTIRVTRRGRDPETPDGTPTGLPVSSPGGESIRLALIEPPAPRTTLDGAWWPRTRDLGHELPGLIEELHRRGIRVTRAAYNPAAWDPAPRRLQADGRVIRLGWVRSLDPQLIDLTGDWHRGRVDLLVVPPDTAPDAARRAVAAATDRANHLAPTALLQQEWAVWDSEEGHLRR